MNKNIVSIIIIFMAGLISSCHNGAPVQKPTDKKDTAQTLSGDVIKLTPAQAKNAGILLGAPEQREIHSTLKVSGVIDVPPQNIVSVCMPLGGYLKTTNMIPGTKVARGTVLATMEDQQYIQVQQDYLTAKSRLQYLEAEYGRQQKLNETKASSDKQYQQSLSDFESQKILLKSLSEKLLLIGVNPDHLTEKTISRTVNIYSSINGFVSKVNVNIGKYVNPTDILFELVNPDDLHLTLTVFENDVLSIMEGQKISCYTNLHPDKKYGATVHLVTPNIGKDRATEVHCHMDQNYKDLLPGMFMNADLELHKTNVLSIPEDAIVKSNNENYIFVEVGDNTYKLQQVEIGMAYNGYVELKSTPPTAKIVLKNAYTLLMKLKNNGDEG